MEKKVKLHADRPHSLTQQSGVTFHEVQVALAKIYIGSDDLGGKTDEVVNIERAHDARTGEDEVGKKDMVEKAVRLPKTEEEAKDIIRRFEAASPESDDNVSVSHSRKPMLMLIYGRSDNSEVSIEWACGL